jgi:O-antigen/teichoic acid export membrane protein
MDQETYGILGMLCSASAVVVGIICLGSDNSYTRFFFERPNNDNIQDYSSKSIRLIVLPLICVSFFLLTAWPFLSVALFETKKIVLIIGMILYSTSLVFYRFQNIYFRMIGDGVRFALLNFLVLVLPRLVLLLIFISLGNIDAIVFMTIVSFLSSIFLLIPYRGTFFSFKNNCYTGYKSYISYALMTAPLIGIDNFNVWVPQYLIKNFCGLGVLGVYNAALIFPAGLNVLKSCFITIWAPYVYKNYKKEEGLFDKYNRIMTCVVVVLMGLILLFSDCIYLLVGESYRYECHILGLIVVIPLYLLLFETTSYGISISKKVYIQTILIASIALFNLVIGKMIGEDVGLAGILLVIAGAYYLFYIISSVISNRYLKMVNSMFRVVLSGTLIFSLAVLFLILYDNRFWFNIVDCTIMIAYIFKYKNDIFDFVIKLRKKWRKA